MSPGKQGENLSYVIKDGRLGRGEKRVQHPVPVGHGRGQFLHQGTGINGMGGVGGIGHRLPGRMTEETRDRELGQLVAHGVGPHRVVGVLVAIAAFEHFDHTQMGQRHVNGTVGKPA